MTENMTMLNVEHCTW